MSVPTILNLAAVAIIAGLLLLLRAARKPSAQSQSGAVRQALIRVLVQGILDWKMTIFLGTILTVANVALLLNAALHGYSKWSDIEVLDWVLIVTSVVGNAALGLAAFLSKQTANNAAELEKRNGGLTSFQKHVASFETEQHLKEQPTKLPVDTAPPAGG